MVQTHPRPAETEYSSVEPGGNGNGAGPLDAAPAVPRSILTVIVAAAIVLGAIVAALGWSATRPKTYAAHAEVLYDVGDASSVDVANQQLATATVIARGRPLVASVARRFDLDVDALARDTHASVVGDSSVIRMTVERHNRQQARRLAQAMAEGWVTEVQNADRSRSEQSRKFLEDQITQLAEQQRKTSERLAAIAAMPATRRAAASAEQGALSASSAQLRAQIATLNDRLVDVQLRQASGGSGSITAPAYTSDGVVSPRPMQALAIGLLIGLLLASVFLAIVWTRRQRTA